MVSCNYCVFPNNFRGTLRGPAGGLALCGQSQRNKSRGTPRRVRLRVRCTEKTRQTGVKAVTEEAKGADRSPREAKVLATFGASGGTSNAAKAVLREAGFTKKADPIAVLGALTFLEQESRPSRSYLPQLNGRWQLVFSSPSVIDAWQYIPVGEDIVIDCARNSILLTSDLGPLYTEFGGRFTYDAANNVMEWGFTELQVKLFGRTILERSLSMARKTYTYFGYDEEVVAARSSGGSLTLLRRRDPSKV